jgi:hypothetical protein
MVHDHNLRHFSQSVEDSVHKLRPMDSSLPKHIYSTFERWCSASDSDQRYFVNPFQERQRETERERQRDRERRGEVTSKRKRQEAGTDLSEVERNAINNHKLDLCKSGPMVERE